MDKITFEAVNTRFTTAEKADDAFVADYVELLKHHLEQKLGDDMRKHLELLLKQAEEKPEEVKEKFTPLLVKPEVVDG